MAAKVVKELFGFSGNQILLMQKHDRLFVRKTGDIERNVERMYALSKNYPLPKIYGYSKNNIDMEYIHGLDIKTYLKTNHYEHLLNFLTTLIDRLKSNSVDKDYSNVYRQKLLEIPFTNEIPFTMDQLFSRLPKMLPQSEYYGDLTLENILYNDRRGFLLIDCQTSDYDSYIFDIAKLRQDLECGWFIRHDSIMIDVKVKHIQQELLKKYPIANNDYLLILMLLRVYRYSKPNTIERNLLLEGINRLWK